MHTEKSTETGKSFRHNSTNFRQNSRNRGAAFSSVFPAGQLRVDWVDARDAFSVFPACSTRIAAISEVRFSSRFISSVIFNVYQDWYSAVASLRIGISRSAFSQASRNLYRLCAPRDVAVGRAQIRARGQEAPDLWFLRRQRMSKVSFQFHNREAPVYIRYASPRSSTVHHAGSGIQTLKEVSEAFHRFAGFGYVAKGQLYRRPVAKPAVVDSGKLSFRSAPDPGLSPHHHRQRRESAANSCVLTVRGLVAPGAYLLCLSGISCQRLQQCSFALISAPNCFARPYMRLHLTPVESRMADSVPG